jgi:hypothetical protein
MKKKKKRSKINWDKFWEEWCNDPHAYDDILCADLPRESAFEDD